MPPPPPPPPPPPGPPPPAPPPLTGLGGSGSSSAAGRNQLLKDIQKGTGLRKVDKTQIKDRSSPLVNDKVSNTPRNGPLKPKLVNDDDQRSSGHVAASASALSGLFAGGMPTLKPTTGTPRVGNQNPKRLAQNEPAIAHSPTAQPTKTNAPPPPPANKKPSYVGVDSQNGSTKTANGPVRQMSNVVPEGSSVRQFEQPASPVVNNGQVNFRPQQKPGAFVPVRKSSLSTGDPPPLSPKPDALKAAPPLPSKGPSAKPTNLNVNAAIKSGTMTIGRQKLPARPGVAGQWPVSAASSQRGLPRASSDENLSVPPPPPPRADLPNRVPSSGPRPRPPPPPLRGPAPNKPTSAPPPPPNVIKPSVPPPAVPAPALIKPQAPQIMYGNQNGPRRGPPIDDTPPPPPPVRLESVRSSRSLEERFTFLDITSLKQPEPFKNVPKTYASKATSRNKHVAPRQPS